MKKEKKRQIVWIIVYNSPNSITNVQENVAFVLMYLVDGTEF